MAKAKEQIGYRVIFISEECAEQAIIAASCMSSEKIATVAAVPGFQQQKVLQKALGKEGLGWPGKIITTEDIDIFGFDLAVFIGDSDALPFPALPGLPPVLRWAAVKSKNREALIHATRDRIKELVDGYLATLISSRKNSELVLDNLQEGIIAHDNDRRIFFFNKGAERITGYQRDEVLGRDCHQVFPGSFCGGKCSFCNADHPSILPLAPYHLQFVSVSGEPRHLEMSVTPVTDQLGEVQGIVASFRDQSRELELACRLGEIERFSGIIGRDSRMQEVYQTIRELADSNVPVLINGESGTGKELVAAAIHNEGNRGRKLFVPINCGALPENLLESELFGHVRGAFTGAVRDKKGRFELADGGTIFLDEIGDISLAMQVKLLRVLHDGTFHRVGGEEMVKVDVRVVSATHKDLRSEISLGRFREDLFYRICVVPISLPPLRERRADIPLLVDHFIQQANREEGREHFSLAPETLDRMLGYDWPGNVRELQNVIRFLMVRCREDVALPHHLPENIRNIGVGTSSATRIPGKRRKGLSVGQVRSALQEAGNNRLQAAKILGVGRATLYRFLDNHPEASQSL